MTYCLGIKVEEGLVALADTRITSGSETTTAKKITIHSRGNNQLFLMTSGLRSIRDKAVTYFEEILEND
ncbi:MAG: peptidase, partial [Bacteroidota bacterium]